MTIFGYGKEKNPQVVEHLTKENKFTDQVLAPVKTLEDALFQELKSRVKEDESSTPVKDGDYYYEVRYEKGQQYPLYVRHKNSPKNPEEILLNVPEMAKGHSFFQTSRPYMNPHQDIMAYAVDTVGRRFF